MWRTVKRNRSRPASREVPLTTSARIVGTGLLFACRALARMAARGRSTPRGGMARAAAMRRAGMRRRATRRSGGMMRGIGAMSRAGTSRVAERMPQSMTRMTSTDLGRIAGGMGAVAVTAGVVRWLASRSTEAAGERQNRWMMITINCPPQRLASRADLPAPISRLGDAVDIKIGPAPGDRGSELGVRLRELPRLRLAGGSPRRPGGDPRRAVREALREAKSLIETGEILRRDRPMPERPAPAGKLLEFAGRRGGRP